MEPPVSAGYQALGTATLAGSCVIGDGVPAAPAVARRQSSQPASQPPTCAAASQPRTHAPSQPASRRRGPGLRITCVVQAVCRHTRTATRLLVLKYRHYHTVCRLLALGVPAGTVLRYWPYSLPYLCHTCTSRILLQEIYYSFQAVA